MPRIASFKKLNDSQVAENVDKKLEFLIKDSYKVDYLGKNRNEIKILEEIRGRPYMTCTICNEDLTLKRCEHHPKSGFAGSIGGK